MPLCEECDGEGTRCILRAPSPGGVIRATILRDCPACEGRGWT